MQVQSETVNNRFKDLAFVEGDRIARDPEQNLKLIKNKFRLESLIWLAELEKSEMRAAWITYKIALEDNRRKRYIFL